MASAMRRLVYSVLALSLAAAAFALGACGGDDNKSNSSKPTLTLQQPGTAKAPTGPTSGTNDQSGSSGKKSKRSGSSTSGTSKKQKKEKLNKALAEALTPAGQDKVSYEAARQVCRQRTLKEIREAYKVKSKSYDAIAKAVGKQYYPASRARAAVKGCAKGLSER
jgi:hypothetical protein